MNSSANQTSASSKAAQAVGMPASSAPRSIRSTVELLRYRLLIFLAAVMALELLLGLLALWWSPSRSWRDVALVVLLIALAGIAWRAGQAVDPAVHRRLDLGVTSLIALFHQSHLLETSRGPEVWHQVELSLVVLLFLRSALVPSRAVHTAQVGLVVLSPMVLVAALFQLGPTPWLAATPSGFAPIVQVAVLGVVWACTVGLSGVLHGWQSPRRVGDRLGPYTLLGKLGEGGMGTVFLAQHDMLNRPVAIKVMRPDRGDECSLSCFEGEVQHTSQLAHRNTVTIFDYGRTPRGAFYYAMEYLDGVDLERIVRRSGPMSPERVVAVLAQICASLEEAHASGLCHRDIKPANVVLCRHAGEHDVVKVVDFGLARAHDDAYGAGAAPAGLIAGTPDYLAPEAIALPETVDERSDLYSVGAVGYFLLVGEPVFPSDDSQEVLRRQLVEQPLPPSLRSPTPIPPALDRLIVALLDKNPRRRPRSARELRRMLLQIVPPSQSWTEEQAATWWTMHGGWVRSEEPAARADSEQATTVATGSRPESPDETLPPASSPLLLEEVSADEPRWTLPPASHPLLLGEVSVFDEPAPVSSTA